MIKQPPRVIIFIGVPGSGKGTQAKLLAASSGYTHISTGELLRKLQTNPHTSPEDQTLLLAMKRGEKVADELIYRLAFAAIQTIVAQGGGVILDGAIRSREQAIAYQAFFTELGLADRVVAVLLHITDDDSRMRLQTRKMCRECGHSIVATKENETQTTCDICGGTLFVREDDTPEAIEQRIHDQGNEATQPIVDYYTELGTLLTIDASKSVESVSLDLRQQVDC